jgi:hypothetical protein
VQTQSTTPGGGGSLAGYYCDKIITSTNKTGHWYGPAGGSFPGNGDMYYTARPTNTSVLFCIATKDIYSNPMNDYSTTEKVVGTWIDGKPLYQRTIVTTLPTVATDYVVAHKDINVASYNVDTAVSLGGMFDNGNVYINIGVGIGSITFDASAYVGGTSIWYNKSDANINIEHNRTGWSGRNCYITFQYTKSTD